MERSRALQRQTEGRSLNSSCSAQHIRELGRLSSESQPVYAQRGNDVSAFQGVEGAQWEVGKSIWPQRVDSPVPMQRGQRIHQALDLD